MAAILVSIQSWDTSPPVLPASPKPTPNKNIKSELSWRNLGLKWTPHLSPQIEKVNFSLRTGYKVDTSPLKLKSELLMESLECDAAYRKVTVSFSFVDYSLFGRNTVHITCRYFIKKIKFVSLQIIVDIRPTHMSKS